MSESIDSSGPAIPNRRLLLMRHAKSSRDDPTLEDRARPLASRGVWAAGAISRYIRERDLTPDYVICSSALRTRETLRIVEPVWPRPVTTSIEEALYLADATQLLERLTRIADNFGTVLVIGHNPGIEDLAWLLCQGGRNKARKRLTKGFRTGALAELDLPIRAWDQLGVGAGRLRHFTRPKDLL